MVQQLGVPSSMTQGRTFAYNPYTHRYFTLPEGVCQWQKHIFWSESGFAGLRKWDRAQNCLPDLRVAAAIWNNLEPHLHGAESSKRGCRPREAADS